MSTTGAPLSTAQQPSTEYEVLLVPSVRSTYGYPSTTPLWRQHTKRRHRGLPSTNHIDADTQLHDAPRLDTMPYWPSRKRYLAVLPNINPSPPGPCPQPPRLTSRSARARRKRNTTIQPPQATSTLTILTDMRHLSLLSLHHRHHQQPAARTTCHHPPLHPPASAHHAATWPSVAVPVCRLPCSPRRRRAAPRRAVPPSVPDVTLVLPSRGPWAPVMQS